VGCKLPPDLRKFVLFSKKDIQGALQINVFFAIFFAIFLPFSELFFQKCEKSFFLGFWIARFERKYKYKVTIFKVRFQPLANKIKG
jgi:hypothetical protein